MSLNFVTLDVFTSRRCSGNPVAIVHLPLDRTLNQKQKQLIAREFNLSETVFLHEQTEFERESGDVRIDIFTAIAEVNFAGHPTIGTSNYLLRYAKDEQGWCKVNTLITKAGRVPIALDENGTGVRLEVAHNVHVHDSPFKGQSFGLYPVVSIVKGMTFILADLQKLENLKEPQANLLGTERTYTSHGNLDEGWRQGIVASYFYVDLGNVSNHRHLRSRMFGSREDPATGSAASALCSYLSLVERGARVRQYLVTQGVEMGRPSDIRIRITLNEGLSEVQEVLLMGQAIKEMSGTLEIPDVEQ